MKKFLFLATAVAFVMLSCQKEVQKENQEVLGGLVKMTFQASMEADATTRAVLAANGKSTEWKAGDEIAVFDNVNSTIHKFVAESDGATTSFTGTVNAGATSFVAVYPYTDDTAYNSESETPISANIPVIQEAVKDSYDPKAALFVAEATHDPLGEDKVINQKFAFTPAFALFKVNVDVDDVMALYVENTKIAMSGSVAVKTTGSLSNGTGNVYKWISLQKEDGTVLEKGTYYIVSRFAGTNSLENFKMMYVKNDITASTRSASGPITKEKIARKSIVDAGSLSSFPSAPVFSKHAYYQAAYDVKVGARNFNHLTDGDATLIENTSSSESMDITSIISTKKGVFFLKSAGGAFTSGSSNINVTNELVLINDSSTETVFAFTSDKSWNFRGGSLYVKNLSFNTTGRTSGAVFSNNSTTEDSDLLVMDECKVFGLTKSLFQPNSSFLAYVIKNYEITNSTFALTATSTYSLINEGSCANTGKMEKMLFKNNLVYLTTGTQKVNVVNMPTTGDCTMIADIQNNLFVNAAATFIFTDLSSIVLKHNAYYDANSFASSIRLFDVKTTSTISDLTTADNIVSGLASDKKWTYTVGDVVTNNPAVKAALPEGTNEITKSSASDIFSTIPSISAGEVSFVLQSAYSDCGPQAL